MTTLFERIRFALHYWRWFLTDYVPIAGADGADDDRDDKSKSKDDDKADDDKSKADDDDQDDDEDEDDEKKSKSDGELRRKLAEARRKATKAEKKLKEAEEQKAKDEGKWKELAEQRQEELDKAQAKVEESEKRGTIEKVAKRLDFADPDDGVRNLSLADIDAEDEAGIERELKAVLDQKPHLKKGDDDKGPSGPTRTRKRQKKSDMDSLIRRSAGR